MPTLKRSSSRYFALCALLFCGFAAMMPQARAGEDAATQFLFNLQDQTVLQLADPGIPDQERAIRFKKLFGRHFDVPTIGRFVVGRYWRSAPTADRDAFLKVFQEAMEQRFLPFLAQAGSTQLRLGSATRDAKKTSIVRLDSEVTRGGGEAFKVVWVLRERDGDFRILDVVTEGISMAITLRSEYGSAIRASGRGLAGLTEKLRSMVARGAFAPKDSDVRTDSAQAE